MYTAVYCFIGGVIMIGIGTGFYLQFKLEETHQDIAYPSAFLAKA
jgi:hypothetical protein